LQLLAVRQIILRMVIAMLILVMVVLQTQVVSGAIIVVSLRTRKSLVQVELQHVKKMAKEKIQVVSTRVKAIQLEIHGRMIAIRVHAVMEKFLARHCHVH